MGDDMVFGWDMDDVGMWYGWLSRDWDDLCNNKKSNFAPVDVRIGGVSAVHILHLLLPVKRLAAFRHSLRLLRWFDPSFLLAVVWLLLSALMVIWVFLALALSALVGIPSILPQFFDLLQLLLLFLQLLLLFLDLLLSLLFFPGVFLPLLLDGRVHVDELTVLLQCPWVLALLLGDLLVQSLSVLLYWVFCVLVDGDFDHSVVPDLLLLAVEIF